MTYSEYSALPGIRGTEIKRGAVSMAHMRLAVTDPAPPTPAQEWGTLVHMAVLEPARIAQEVAVWDGRRAGAEYNQFVADNPPGTTIIKPNQLESLNAITSAVRSNTDAAQLLAGCEYEYVLQWEGPGYGQGKARCDAWRPGCIVDIKTCADIAAFDRAVWRYSYHLQAGWYAHGASMLTGQNHDVYFLAVESRPPYCVVPYKVGYGALELGEREAVRIATEYHACEQTGVFPGIGGPIRVLELPPYLQDQELTGFDEEGET